MNRQRFANALKKRFSLRFHMTLILLATSIVGVLISKGMLAMGLDNVAIRYPVTVLVAYGVFFAAIKIWLLMVTDASTVNSRDTVLNGLDSLDILLPSGDSGEVTFSGAGGAFDGGGASGDFSDSLGDMASDSGDAVGGAGSVISDAVAGVGDVVGGAVSGIGEAVGSAVDGVVDDEIGIVLVIVFGLLVALLFSVLGVGLYIVWEAPAILAEAVFDTVLAASLVRSTKQMNEPDWMENVFKATWKPFAIVLGFSVISGWAMHHYAPEASRMMDVIHLVF